MNSAVYRLVLLFVCLVLTVGYRLSGRRDGNLFRLHAGRGRPGGSSSSSRSRPAGQRTSSTGSGRFESNPAKDIRKLRFARILRDELSDIICNCDIRASVFPEDGLLDGVYIDNIELTTDFERAKVFISVFGNTVERKQTYVWLNNNVGQIRFSLSQRMKNIRKVPLLSFVLIDTQSINMLNDAFDEISAAAAPEDEVEEMDFEEMN